MREIRSRIAERHGIDLTPQQIQELAARRLEAILDPRTVKPSLMDELRRSAGLPADAPPMESEAEQTLDESVLYATDNSFLRAIRRLLNPLLRLFFNPTALADAFSSQSRVAKRTAERDAEHRRRQTEWNALHFEILRRLVTDIARAEIENQHLTQRIESLTARVDFNERRVRSFEQTQQVARPTPRTPDVPASLAAPTAVRAEATPSESTESSIESSRRRRRRRRGRRPGGGPPRDFGTSPLVGAAEAAAAAEQNDGEDFVDDDSAPEDLDETVAESVAVAAPVVALEPASEPHAPAAVSPPATQEQGPESEPPPPSQEESHPAETMERQEPLPPEQS